ncbi:MAG: nucleotidyltransferase domain-containing protein [Ignavibacterium sp.]
MDKKVKDILSDLKQHLEDHFGSSIKDVILYGSYAKNVGNMESDIDVLILVDNSITPSDVRSYLSDFILDVLLNKKELISVIVLPLDYYLSKNYPFILNVKKEGLKV